jgi:1,2-diacylglycerol 3-beta-galactosyltransferase
MIMMSDTGGGHRASAEALKAAFHMLYDDQFQVHAVVIVVYNL